MASSGRFSRIGRARTCSLSNARWPLDAKTKLEFSAPAGVLHGVFWQVLSHRKSENLLAEQRQVASGRQDKVRILGACWRAAWRLLAGSLASEEREPAR